MYALYQLENGDLICNYNVDPLTDNPAIILIKDDKVEIIDCYEPSYFNFVLPNDEKLVTMVNIEWSYSENEFGDFIHTITISSRSNELIAEIACERCMGEYIESIKKKKLLAA